MLRLFFLAICLFSIQFLEAQMNCGTPQAPLLERVDANKKLIQIHQRGVVKYIPVTFHLVANTAGNGRISELAVLNQLCNLNRQFVDQEAIFYIYKLSYFDNDAVYEMPASTAATIQMRLRKDPKSVNIFITNKADSENEGPGQTLAYYDPQEDWIVSRKDQISLTSKTLAHEVGHFFSLPHTFAGWECNPYTEEDYGNPVNVDFTLPCSGGGGSVLIEFKDGSNCNNAGDRICDTPADYNLPILFDPGCDENTIVRDKHGELIMPMIKNYMSYYADCDTNMFTATQKNLMNTDFFSSQRAYLRINHEDPNTDPVEGPVAYITPINGEVTNGFTNIFFDWEDVPGATNYMIQIARNSSFTLNLETHFSDVSELIVDELLIQNYYWRVFPYNESQTCAGFSPTQNFKVGPSVGVNEISAINDFWISPNPVGDMDPAALTLASIKSFEASIAILSASGIILSRKDIVVPAGTSVHSLETSGLSAGVYFVMVNSISGTLVERLLIMH